LLDQPTIREQAPRELTAEARATRRVPPRVEAQRRRRAEELLALLRGLD